MIQSIVSMVKTIVKNTQNITLFLAGEFFGLVGEGVNGLDEDSKQEATLQKEMIFVIALI